MAKFLYSRAHHQPDNKKHFFVLLVFILLFMLVSFFVYHAITFRAEDRVIGEYLKALKNHDKATIKGLVAVEYDPKNEIEKEIDNSSDISFVVFTDYDPSPRSGIEKVANIYGFRGVIPFRKKVYIAGMEDAWYLVLGELKDEFKKEGENYIK